MASLFDVSLRPSEPADQEIPEALLGTCEIRRRVHGPQKVVLRDLSIECGDQACESFRANHRINIEFLHIATSNSEAFANAAGTEALAQPSGTDKKTAIKFLSDSFDKCAKDFAAMTPSQLNRMVDIGAGRQALAIEVLWWAFTDTAHHRGQSEVYLRVKNIKPPGYVLQSPGYSNHPDQWRGSRHARNTSLRRLFAGNWG
jgi:hypothetical protein